MKHRCDRALGLGTDFGGAGNLDSNRDRGLLASFLSSNIKLCLDLRFGFGFRNDGVAVGHVKPLRTVDPHFLDAAGEYALDILGVSDDKGVAPEGVFHPGAAELLEVHANGKLVDADFLEHGRRGGFVVHQRKGSYYFYL